VYSHISLVDVPSRSKKFAIIRIPFNSITVVDLQRILLVKGISDWSIERIVEQTIVRGGIAIVHLEECPADYQLQEDLFGTIPGPIQQALSLYFFRLSSSHGEDKRLFASCRSTGLKKTSAAYKKGCFYNRA
jgi:hypothetical protein